MLATKVSSIGFDGNFRLELVSGGTPVRLGELELRCRLRKAAKLFFTLPASPARASPPVKRYPPNVGHS